MIYKITLVFLLITASVLSVSAYDSLFFQRIFNLDQKQLNSEIKELEREEKERKSQIEYHLTIGMLYYMQATNGKKTAGKAIFHLETYLKIHNDVLIKAYLGSCYTIYGGDEGNLAYITEGLALIDKACSEQPDNYLVRMNRINTALGSPNFLYIKRKELVHRDIEHLLKLVYEQKPDRKLQGEILFTKALIFLKERKKEEAVKLLEEIIGKYPENREAREKLEELL